MTRIDDNLPQDLQEVASLLERERPQMSALELDSIRRRVAVRSSRGRTRHPKGTFMKSRIAIISMLTAGLLMSGTGATLALDGLNTRQDASIAQYGPSAPGGGVLGDNESGGNEGVVPPPQGAGNAGGGDEGGNAGAGAPNVAQPSRQVELGSTTPGELPFTGYAGFTVLLLGLALLGGGLVLRRSAHQQ